MNDADLLARALELADRARDGLTTEQWQTVRDASALLRQRLNGREPTAKERWLLQTGSKVEAWLGPAEIGNQEGA